MNLKSKTALFYDHGLFIPMAQKLSESFGRVFYFSEWKTGFPLSRQAAIGNGMPGIERVTDFFDHVEEADVIVFPDIYNGDLQEYLRAQGKAVWGSGKAEQLEMQRYDTKKYLEKIGLPVNKYRRLTGIKALKEYLKSAPDKWIKVQGFRGDGETFHSINYKLSEPRLNEWEYKLGPMGKKMEFIVEDPLEAVSEWGFDGICVDGKFPTLSTQGVEAKNEAYCGIVRNYEDMIPQLLNVNKRIAPALREYEYRGMFSTEVRIAKDMKGYFTDPCCRMAAPAGGAALELFSNWGEIVWAGAHGEMVDPKPVATYGVEVLINCCADGRNWIPVYFPKEIEKNVKLRYATRIDGEYNIANQDQGTVQIGSVVATGKTLLEACRKVKEMCGKVEGLGLEIKPQSLIGAIDAIRDSEKLGLPVAPDPIPSAEEVQKALA